MLSMNGNPSRRAPGRVGHSSLIMLVGTSAGHLEKLNYSLGTFFQDASSILNQVTKTSRLRSNDHISYAVECEKGCSWQNSRPDMPASQGSKPESRGQAEEGLTPSAHEGRAPRGTPAPQGGAGTGTPQPA